MVSSQLLKICWKCKRNASKKWGKWKRKTKIAESWDRLQLLGRTPIRLLTGSSSYTHYDSLQLIENALSLNPSLFSTFSWWYLFKKSRISGWILLTLHNISRPLLMVDTSSLKGWLGVAVRPAGRLQPCQITAPPLRQIHEDRHRFVLFKDFNSQINIICITRSLGALRAPTSSLWPFGPALGPSGLLYFVLRALWALRPMASVRPCDPRDSAMIG